MKVFLSTILGGMVLFSSDAFAQSISGQPFHAPETSVERALHDLFQVSLKNDSFQAVFYRKDVSGSGPDINLLDFITQPLWDAISKAEFDSVQSECGGVYQEEERCGLDYDVLFCGQDYPDTFLFQTLHMDDDRATLTYAWGGGNADTAPVSYEPEYRMLRQDGTWKLDGIDCGAGRAFNMGDASRLPQ